MVTKLDQGIKDEEKKHKKKEKRDKRYDLVKRAQKKTGKPLQTKTQRRFIRKDSMKQKIHQRQSVPQPLRKKKK